MRKKIMNVKTQHGALQGRKSKEGGGKKIKSDSRIYTPVKLSPQLLGKPSNLVYLCLKLEYIFFF